MLTLQQAIDIGITHALMGAPAEEIEERVLVNLAGKHLAGMRRWHWMERQVAFLGTTAGQAYLTLPQGCERLIDIMPYNDVSVTVSHSTLTDIQQMQRANITPAATTFWVAEEYASDFSEGVGPVRMRLAIWPIPEADSTNLFTIRYGGGWRDVLECEFPETEFLPLPEDSSCDALYLQILRAFAQGWEEDAKATLEMRLSELRVGETFTAAVAVDNRRNDRNRVLRNTALEMANRTHPRFRNYLNRLPEGYGS